MGMKDLLIYSHTDYSDVWKPLFVSIEKYLQGFNIIFLINKFSEEVPEKYSQIIYDESLCYTDRLKFCLKQVNTEFFMFMHEDMILFDKINFQILEKYIGYVNDEILDSVKLILAGDRFESWPIDNTLVTNQYSKFSIQPTVTRKNVFKEKHSNRIFWNF